MTSLTIITRIKAPSKIVFDVSRNIEIHQLSVAHTNEKAIAGTTSGLIGLNETVTFRGKHFGIYLTHQSQITEMSAPDYFTDEMIKGHFSFFRHEHIFEIQEDATIMTDKIQYKVPFGSIGKLFDFFILKRYLRTMIRKRNKLLKYIAEN
ncbi:SRPBCC family protein [Flavobacterium cerinum]|uniref:SRPBCC family protein n=1 Tax=Flavobacterium cerinum TaxID=2502784 RepID=A0ABY5IZJ6_9FLAO|nr:SRPBCC family protein [Flavobacterium cerinum]UUC46926.1 SRPBCC family protein [Flavobacterium cerinum]